MTELTRRQMRELERSGQLQVEQPIREAVIETQVSMAVSEQKPTSTPSPVVQITSRRQLREQSFQSSAPAAQADAIDTSTPVPTATESTEYELPAAIAPRRLAPVPPVGSRRALRETSAVVPPEAVEELSEIDVEIPEDGFRGANYLGEPSTQSIMLDIAPEAIALPLDTGEVLTTGSIAILPEVPGPTTGGLDGAELDLTEDAVTGVLSVVDPVSAKTLIDERSVIGVVPEGVLRRGWWRPWVVGAISVLMALVAIIASITILNALGE